MTSRGTTPGLGAPSKVRTEDPVTEPTGLPTPDLEGPAPHTGPPSLHDDPEAAEEARLDQILAGLSGRPEVEYKEKKESAGEDGVRFHGMARVPGATPHDTVPNEKVIFGRAGRNGESADTVITVDSRKKSPTPTPAGGRLRAGVLAGVAVAVLLAGALALKSIGTGPKPVPSAEPSSTPSSTSALSTSSSAVASSPSVGSTTALPSVAQHVPVAPASATSSKPSPVLPTASSGVPSSAQLPSASAPSAPKTAAPPSSTTSPTAPTAPPSPSSSTPPPASSIHGIFQ